MRYLLLLLMLFSVKTSAQNSGEEIKTLNGSYYFKKSPPGDKELQTRSDDLTDIGIPIGAKVYIIYEDENYVYYKYWPFTNEKLKEIYNEFIGNEPIRDTIGIDNISPFKPGTNGNNHFYMEKDTFVRLTSPIYRRFKGFSVGAYTVPFRIRGIGDDFDFESALSLQANLIAGLGSRTSERSWLDLSIGLGLTGIKLDSDNSDVENNRTANAFTTSLGLVVKPKPYANIGFFVGWDFLGKNDKEINWQYNEKPWLGLGINISFNEVTTEKSPDSVSDTGEKKQKLN